MNSVYKIDELVDEIYDPNIKDYTTNDFVYITIKSFIRAGILEGIRLGKQELFDEIIESCKKHGVSTPASMLSEWYEHNENKGI